jgi:nicotinamide riboside kinase
MGQWSYIPVATRPYFVRRVAILGTESSGKTTLAQQLAKHFETTWVPEYGRTFCETRDPLRLTATDFEAIAWGQATWEDEAAPRANRVLISDTDLHTTCTWSDLIVGSRSAWLSTVARNRKYDLMLLLDGDVPWIDDGTRVLGMRRAEHSALLRAELEGAGRDFTVVRGTFDERFAIAAPPRRRTSPRWRTSSGDARQVMNVPDAAIFMMAHIARARVAGAPSPGQCDRTLSSSRGSQRAGFNSGSAPGSSRWR